MCEPSCSSTSSPRFVLTWTPIWLVIVPEGAYRAASLPSRSATYLSSRSTVGSSPNTSSPTGASSITRRMLSVGLVTVSLRRSIKGCLHHCVLCSPIPDAWWRSVAWPPPPALPPHVPWRHACLPRLRASRRAAIGTRLARKDGRSPRAAAPALLWKQRPRQRRPRPECVPRASLPRAHKAPDRSGRNGQTRLPRLPRPHPQVHP